MGDTGPCGPCSEIFYDHGAHIPGGPPGSSEAEGDRFIEIWNLVFMQYEQLATGERVPLPKPSIDTGMGLERTAAVMQSTHDNYEIDLMQALIHASAEASGTDPFGEYGISHRVIADHLRAASFLIADGVTPANEGRGYVLRRIMRRAMRHAHLLGCQEPLMWRLVPALTAKMGGAYPELSQAETLISETLELEETRFKRTLDRGLKLLDEATASLPKAGQLDGETAFRLYDTFGFPLDLTQDVLRGRGLTVDVDGFSRSMARQREEARRAWAGSGEAATEAVWFAVREDVGASEFLGYGSEEAEGQIVALVVGGERVAAAESGSEVAVVCNQTPFYGESGGQMGDAGIITGPDGLRIAVTDTQKKLGDVHVHLGRVEAGRARVGDDVRLAVDHGRRLALRAHHSATHLLHEALRRRLGSHVTQKGSLVAPDRLRFDISHPKAIAAGDLTLIEAEVNARVRANDAVDTHLMDPDSAVAAGAMALFGEKYGDEVRVVTMGGGEVGRAYSTELCGGTHVRRTGDIGLFKIVGESALAAGVRRIEAVTGAAAEAHVAAEEEALHAAAGLLKTAPAEVPARVAALLEERRRLERELAETRRTLATGGGAAADVREVAGIRFAPRQLAGVPARELKTLADDLKKQLGSGVVALVSAVDGKASLVVGVTSDLTGRVSAVDLVKAGAAALGGSGGGGRPDMAQAGGPDVGHTEAALAAIEQALAAA
jgi:alanyl-tRNA synthetase